MKPFNLFDLFIFQIMEYKCGILIQIKKEDKYKNCNFKGRRLDKFKNKNKLVFGGVGDR